MSIPNEEWCIIQGHPDYRISTQGEYQSKKRGGWKTLKTSLDGGGYPQAFMSENGVRYVRKVHKLMQDAFFEYDPDKPEINHVNGDKTDNRLENLEQCSRLENQLHAVETGLWVRPDNAGRPKKRVRIIETGELFASESECARAINGKVSNLHHCLTGNRHTHRGFHFEYAD